MSRKSISDREFAANWVRSQRALSAFVIASIPHYHEAEDVVQRVAMTAFETRERYAPEASQFSTWVIGIARNEIMHWHRSRGRGRLVFDDEVLDALASAAVDVGPQHTEVYEALIKCLNRVEGRPLEMLRLRYDESLRSDEIAKRCDTTRNVVDKTLSRVRQALRRCIADATKIDGVSP